MSKSWFQQRVRTLALVIGVIVVLGLTLVCATNRGQRRFADYFPRPSDESVGKVFIQLMWEQRWMVVFALGLSVLVAFAVVPRRQKTELHGFPWFWIAFPLTSLSAATSVAVWWPDFPSMFGAGLMYMPLGDGDGGLPGLDYLPSGQKWKMGAVMIGAPVITVVGMIASAWAWRAQRY